MGVKTAKIKTAEKGEKIRKENVNSRDWKGLPRKVGNSTFLGAGEKKKDCCLKDHFHLERSITAFEGGEKVVKLL